MIWNPDTEAAFEKCKKNLADVALLMHPAANAKLQIVSDASDITMGAVLEQHEEDGWRPLSFFSRKFTKAEKNYSTYDSELTALYEAVIYFRQWIEGNNKVVLCTDHKPLLSAFNQLKDKVSPRVQRQLSVISEFSTNIQWIKGEENTVADALSRIAGLTAVPMPTIINWNELANARANDEDLKALLTSKTTNLRFKKLTYGVPVREVQCDVSTSNIRPYLPAKFTKQGFDLFHKPVHANGKSRVKMIAQRYVWPRMKKDIVNWARTCLPCQESKVSRHVYVPPALFIAPNHRFKHVHVDLVGPIEEPEGYKYCMTMVDRYTQWVEAVPTLT